MWTQSHLYYWARPSRRGRAGRVDRFRSISAGATEEETLQIVTAGLIASPAFQWRDRSALSKASARSRHDTSNVPVKHQLMWSRYAQRRSLLDHRLKRRSLMLQPLHKLTRLDAPPRLRAAEQCAARRYPGRCLSARRGGCAQHGRAAWRGCRIINCARRSAFRARTMQTPNRRNAPLTWMASLVFIPSMASLLDAWQSRASCDHPCLRRAGRIAQSLQGHGTDGARRGR